jgi:beta-xylosidase
MIARPRLLAALSCLAAVALAGCGSSNPTGSGSAPGSASGPASGSGSAAAGYVNPVYNQDFPDPAVLRVGNRFYAYATQGNDHNIQTLTSSDLVHWRPGPDALPELPGWASPGYTWAPEVLPIAGGYSMYYVARDNSSNKQCIGHAVASAPSGPFRDAAAKPLLCQTELGGSIDPDPIKAADGSLYLYWKNDGNCCDLPVHLWGQRLSADGTAPLDRPAQLLSNTKPWQGSLIEAPEMVTHAGSYTLFYSANDYASAKYGIGYAHCTGPLGPCTDRSNAPLVSSDDAAAGPGHCFVLQLSNGTWQLLYHAWPPDAIGSQSPGRQLWLEPLTWQGDVPSVHPSDASYQPAPSV